MKIIKQLLILILRLMHRPPRQVEVCFYGNRYPLKVNDKGIIFLGHMEEEYVGLPTASCSIAVFELCDVHHGVSTGTVEEKFTYLYLTRAKIRFTGYYCNGEGVVLKELNPIRKRFLSKPIA